MSKVTMPAPTVTKWRVPITDYDGNRFRESDWKYEVGKGGGLPWWTREHLITTDQAEAYANARVREALNSFIKIMGEMQSELDESGDDPIPSGLWSLWRELLDTAPQPAEQPVPVFSDEENVSMPRGLIAAACSAIDKKRDAENVLSELRRYTLGDLSRQTAPDVEALVEALEWLRGAINCTPENDKHKSGTWISTKHPRIRQIDGLLAAYRKQGGEV